MGSSSGGGSKSSSSSSKSSSSSAYKSALTSAVSRALGAAVGGVAAGPVGAALGANLAPAVSKAVSTVSSGGSPGGGGSSLGTAVGGVGAEAVGGGGTQYENRVIGGASYTVPVGTRSDWQPGQPYVLPTTQQPVREQTAEPATPAQTQPPAQQPVQPQQPQYQYPTISYPKVNIPEVTVPEVTVPSYRPPTVEEEPLIEGVSEIETTGAQSERLPEGVRRGVSGFEYVGTGTVSAPSVDELVQRYREVFGQGTDEDYARQYFGSPQFQRVLEGATPMWMATDPLWSQYLRRLGLAVGRRLGQTQ